MGDKWLDGYAGQTTEQLLALAGEYRIDSLVLAFEEGLQRKPRPMAREERYVLAVEALEREVNNGGYHQFFLNTHDWFLDVIEEALLAIGCAKTAAITHDAIAALGIPTTAGDAEVEAAVLADSDARRDALGRCDDRYFDSDEPIADRLFEWIARNAGLVRLGGA